MTDRRIFLIGVPTVLFVTLLSKDLLLLDEQLRAHSMPFVVSWGHSTGPDFVLNTLLFIPVGFGLTGMLRHLGWRFVPHVIATVLGFGLVFSYAIEALQTLMPSRSPSLVDVAANMLGAITGSAILRVRETHNYSLAVLAYACCFVIMSVPLQWSSSLANWDRRFPLLIGNERTGDRSWRGHISEVRIADRALASSHVGQVLGGARAVSALDRRLVADYRLTGGTFPRRHWQSSGTDMARSAADDWARSGRPGGSSWLVRNGRGCDDVEQ